MITPGAEGPLRETIKENNDNCLLFDAVLIATAMRRVNNAPRMQMHLTVFFQISSKVLRYIETILFISRRERLLRGKMISYIGGGEHFWG